MYDDFKVLPLELMEKVASEYSHQTANIKAMSYEERLSKIFGAQSKILYGSIIEKFNYINSLLSKIALQTSNKDLVDYINNLILELNDLITEYNSFYIEDEVVKTSSKDFECEMLCNNTKLSIQSVFEILDILLNQIVNEQAERVKQIMLEFFKKVTAFGKKLVSIFGECKYRKF